MPFATIDGINTRYDIIGEGPPLLMFSPGGFDATLDKWSTLGVYAKFKPIDHLSKKYCCIVFDRRECGQSGGRVESITWADYVRQGKALLDHLGVERAHLIGGCMGCCPVAAFGVAHPERVLSMILYWPVGGAKYRINGQKRFTEHLGFVSQHGLAAVTELVAKDGKPFGGDPRGGPWASVLRHDKAFADAYVNQNLEQYMRIVAEMSQALLDRDTAPGAEPEDLMRLNIPAMVVPGRDASHATSAARYLEECIPGADYWDIAPTEQTEANVPDRLLAFLGSTGYK